MQRKIRLLLVKDRELDAALFLNQRGREGFEPESKSVDSEPDDRLVMEVEIERAIAERRDAVRKLLDVDALQP